MRSFFLFAGVALTLLIGCGSECPSGYFKAPQGCIAQQMPYYPQQQYPGQQGNYWQQPPPGYQQGNYWQQPPPGYQQGNYWQQPPPGGYQPGFFHY